MIGVLEVGGTHVTGAAVRPADWTVARCERLPLDSGGTAEQVLDAFAAAGAAVAAQGGEDLDATWGIAMPDPFDYERGIATFRGVGKFDAIRGIDVGAVLRARLPGRPDRLAFLNDADAFILGEWSTGAAAGFGRCVGITLGTGLGSGWLVDGRISHSEPGVPALGRARHLIVNGAGLEETISSRALRRAYAAATGDPAADVAQIAARARNGEVAAIETLRHGFTGLGQAMGPAMLAFGADVIVVGGSMAASWDLFEPWLHDGMSWPDAPPVRLAADPDRAAVIGAARYAAEMRATDTP